MTELRRRRESVDQLREQEAADVDTHEEDEKRLAHEAIGSGYFYSPTQQITELTPRTITLTYVDWQGTEIRQTVCLRRWQVRDTVYIEHPGMLTGKRVKIQRVERERELGAWRKKNGGGPK